MRFEQRIADHGVVDDTRADEDAADLRDRAQHQRAIADQVLDQMFSE